MAKRVTSLKSVSRKKRKMINQLDDLVKRDSNPSVDAVSGEVPGICILYSRTESLSQSYVKMCLNIRERMNGFTSVNTRSML